MNPKKDMFEKTESLTEAGLNSYASILCPRFPPKEIDEYLVLHQYLDSIFTSEDAYKAVSSRCIPFPRGDIQAEIHFR